MALCKPRSATGNVSKRYTCVNSMRSYCQPGTSRDPGVLGANGNPCCSDNKKLLVTSQMVRKIRAPRCSRIPPVGLTKDQFSSVKDNAQRAVSDVCRERDVSTERDQLRACGVEARQQALKAAEVRTVQQPDELLDQLAEEERHKLVQTLHRAKIAELEADEEIKVLNQLIGQAKVYTIRDQQVHEKQHIQKAMKNEECRLDLMMEQERLQGLSEEKKRDEERLRLKEKQKHALQEQMSVNKERAVLDEERKYQEAEMLRKNSIQMKLAEVEEQKRRRVRQLEMSRGLDEVNRAQQELASQQRDLDRKQEQRVREYQRRKAEMAAKFEDEQRLQKTLREEEVLKNRAKQRREEDRMAAEHELKAKRDRERKEREWRRKELVDTRKKVERTEDLRHVRRQQIAEKERAMAIEAKREQAEFRRVLDQLRANEQLRVSEEKALREKKLRELGELKTQICQMEQKRSAERREMIEEGIRRRLLDAQKQQKLNELKTAKIKQLSKMNIPPKYMGEVVRKANVAGAAIQAGIQVEEPVEDQQ